MSDDETAKSGGFRIRSKTPRPQTNVGESPKATRQKLDGGIPTQVGGSTASSARPRRDQDEALERGDSPPRKKRVEDFIGHGVFELSKDDAEDYTKHRIDDYDWNNRACDPGVYDDQLDCDDVDLERVKTEAVKHGLDSAKTLEGIQNEVKWLNSFDVMSEVKKCDIPSDKKVIGTTLVLKLKKGVVKARICAQDFKFKEQRDDLYSPTPSVASLRAILALAARKGYPVKIGDFSTAFLHVPIDEDTYVMAPKVLWKDGVPVYWKLNKALYGLRKAPQLFNEFLSGVLERFGMTRLKGEPTVFVKSELNLLVHVDDPLAAGPEHEIEELFKYLENNMSFNRGETIGTEKFVRYLGKEYRRDAKGFIVRMPGKYYQTLISEAGLTGCKPARTAAGADKPSNLKDKETWEEALSKEEHFVFRRLV